ncbi:MAG: fimbrillin family protein, partial [Candidatus Cryptobacteroides sp.]|nr:fimbrillin family protein [Bacteroidales bacterium]MDY6157543.1 fimbrillin family protein [Candidatus Cryptobacteroides sp.]
MKKISVIFAALALLAASCTKTEVVSSDVQSSQRGIGFSAYTAKPTKAPQTDVITDDFNSFQVSAIGNGAVYFNNVTFTKNGEGVWASTPAYFWPAYALDFYAYNKPTNGAFTPTINTTSQTLTFTPSTTLADQEDLVAAYAPNQTQPLSGATPLTFKHYLTQIVVKALNTNPTYGVEVAGVKIAHMQNKVKYTFSSNTAAVATDAADETYSSV